MARRAPKVIAGGTKGTKGHCWWHKGHQRSLLVARRAPKVIAGGTKGAQGHCWWHEGCSRSSLAAQGCPSSLLVAQEVPRSPLVAQGCPRSSPVARRVPKVIASGRVQPPYTEIFLYLFHRLEITHPTHPSQSAPYIWKDRNNTIQLSYRPALHHQLCYAAPSGLSVSLSIPSSDTSQAGLEDPGPGVH